jgi:hypothetical protein
MMSMTAVPTGHCIQQRACRAGARRYLARLGLLSRMVTLRERHQALAARRNRRSEVSVDALRRGRSVEGSDGLAPEPPADRCGLALDRCASLLGLTVAWRRGVGELAGGAVGTAGTALSTW